MMNEIELMRAQLIQLRRTLEGDPATADVRSAADSLEKKVIGVEEHLNQLRTTGRGQDGVRFPQQLSQQIPYLFNGIANGDFKPTNQRGEVAQLFLEQTKQHRRSLDALVSNDLRCSTGGSISAGCREFIRRSTAIS